MADFQGTYVQKGDAIDWTNKSKAVKAGQVVALNGRIGIAAVPIAQNKTGALHVTGVFSLPKKSGDSFEVGAPVYFSASEGATSTDSGNTLAGWATVKAETSDTIVYVKIG